MKDEIKFNTEALNKLLSDAEEAGYDKCKLEIDFITDIAYHEGMNEMLNRILSSLPNEEAITWIRSNRDDLLNG